jgi:hypothetical protein
MSDSTIPTLTDLARRTGVEEYRLAMFGTLVSLPVVAAAVAAIAAALS